jgi:hypothetical protein
MTPKEKAKELVGKFYVNIPLRDCDNRRPHKLALIAVEFAINSPYSFKPMEGGWISGKMYYEEVKQEIEKL